MDGLKAIGEKAHKELIDYLVNYKEISKEEIVIMDDLRAKRNKSSYEGKQIEESYLENKRGKLDNMKKPHNGFSTSKFNKILRVLMNRVPDMFRNVIISDIIQKLKKLINSKIF